MIKKSKITKTTLKRKLLEAESSTILSHKFAHTDINKCSIPKCTGSGVLIQISAIGGKQLINPILIKDGLSEETINSIKKDIKRSSDILTSFKL